MRRRTTLLLATGLLLGVAACGPAQVDVTAEIDVPNPDGEGTAMSPLADLEVQLIPFDRDQVFDSLAQAYGVPEPEVPQALIDARDEVRRAQEAWQAADSRWSAIRDTMQKISDTMENYNPAEGRYVVLFREFSDFEAELSNVERQRERLFQQFNDLQRGTIQASDSVRILKENWADEAFVDVGEALLAAQRASGLEATVDTTDASGTVTFRVPPGTYWVHARYPLTFTELYWNVRIEPARDEPLQLRLTRDNAQERIKL